MEEVESNNSRWKAQAGWELCQTKKKKGIFSRYYSVLKLHGKSMDNRQAQKY